MSRSRIKSAAPFTVEHFEEWAYGLVLDTGELWKVQPFFLDFLEDLFSGVPECWLIVPEGNTKTTSVSGLGLYHCEFMPSAWCPIAASSREQAEVMYRQAEGFVLRTDRLRAIFKCQEGYRRIKTVDGSRLQIMAADDRTGDGIIPTLALCDEGHRMRDMRLYRTWRGKLDKRAGQIVMISTAGEPGQEFELTRERIRQETPVVVRRPGFVHVRSANIALHEWAVEETGDVEDMAAVKAANPFDGVTLETLERKRSSPTMTLQHWRRFVCNLATRSDNAAITELEWERALVEGWEWPEGAPAWLGLDVAWKWDTTGGVPMVVTDDGVRVMGEGFVLVPPRDGSSLDPNLVEAALVEVHQRNPLHTVVMDTNRAEQLAEWISSELGAEVIDRSQGNRDAVDDYNRFMAGLRTGTLKHVGWDELSKHAMNAIARVLPYGDARFDRPSAVRQGGDQEVRVIDLLSAAAMVNSTVDTLAAPSEPWAASW